MPEIARFFGISIAMFFNDHPPPHIHVRYNEQRAIFDIQNLRVIEGYLSPRVLGLIVEWSARYQAELMQNWDRARRQVPLESVPPLE